MALELHKVEIQRIYPPSSNGTAVLVGNDDKTFIVFIGLHEATALLREMKSEPAPRPLTHDLLQSVFLGFDVNVKQIIISDIVDNAFCATLILNQGAATQGGDAAGHRTEVRIDARPSDCFVLAMKNGSDIYVTSRVLEQVRDFSQLLEEEEATFGDGALDVLGDEESFPRGATGGDFLREDEDPGSEGSGDAGDVDDDQF